MEEMKRWTKDKKVDEWIPGWIVDGSQEMQRMDPNGYREAFSHKDDEGFG